MEKEAAPSNQEEVVEPTIKNKVPTVDEETVTKKYSVLKKKYKALRTVS